MLLVNLRSSLCLLVLYLTSEVPFGTYVGNTIYRSFQSYFLSNCLEFKHLLKAKTVPCYCKEDAFVKG